MHDVYGFACGRSRAAPCDVAGCANRSEALCDYPLTGPKEGKTCDKNLCRARRCKQSGKDKDYCPSHDAMARPRLP